MLVNSDSLEASRLLCDFIIAINSYCKKLQYYCNILLTSLLLLTAIATATATTTRTTKSLK